MLEFTLVRDGGVVSCLTEATSNSILPPAAVCQSGTFDEVAGDCAASAWGVADCGRSVAHIVVITATAKPVFRSRFPLLRVPARWIPTVRSSFA